MPRTWYGIAGPGQRRLDRLELGVHPDEDRDLRGRDAVRAISPRIAATIASELGLGGRRTS